jgi:hypothetical protein
VNAGETTNEQCHLSAKKTKRTAGIVAAVTATIKEDQCATCKDIASGHEILLEPNSTSSKMIYLGLVKKSARWAPKLLASGEEEGESPGLSGLC